MKRSKGEEMVLVSYFNITIRKIAINEYNPDSERVKSINFIRTARNEVIKGKVGFFTQRNNADMKTDILKQTIRVSFDLYLLSITNTSKKILDIVEKLDYFSEKENNCYIFDGPKMIGVKLYKKRMPKGNDIIIFEFSNVSIINIDADTIYLH